MKVSIGKMTLEELGRLPDDGNRYELIEGELYVSPAPRTRHQSVSSDLHLLLAAFIKTHRLGRVFAAPVDVRLPLEQTCVQPDLLFVSAEHKAIIGKDRIEGAPDLVVEIASESTARVDENEKLDAYRRAGVPEYWIVDADDMTVLVYRFAESANAKKLHADDVLTTPLFPGLEIPIKSIFEF